MKNRRVNNAQIIKNYSRKSDNKGAFTSNAPSVEHRSPKPASSIETLYRCFALDLLPSDDDTLVDFGFNKFPSDTDQGFLFGLYKDLLLRHVTPEEILQWIAEETLVPNIKRAFYQLPEDCRGIYFLWFLEHSHILEGGLLQEKPDGMSLLRPAVICFCLIWVFSYFFL